MQESNVAAHLTTMRIPVPTEERANAITHGIGLALAFAASVLLLATATRHGDTWNIWGCGIYVTTLIAAYTASTFSHIFQSPRLRHAFRAADQAIIFLFIAGSWTPIAFAWLRGNPWWWLLHGAMWGVGLGGFVSKALFTHRVHLGAVSLALYVLQGSLPAFAAWPMIGVVPNGMLFWFWASGICYLAGTVFFIYDHRIRYFHTLWHVAVLAGTTCHYIGVLKYCTGVGH
jgi:hemolysin III